MTTPAVDLPLVVDQAAKRFGDVQALAGASFEVRRGELVGLLGPNGAGKTTVIRAIAGRLKLDSGTIQVFGRTLARRDERPEIGIVPQEIALYPLLTARENLEVFGKLYGVDARTLGDRVSWALEWSDLKDRSKESTKGFSGGMKRRLNIACSLLHQPKLVLLDEPTAGVDPQSRERIYEMLADLQKTDVSIVLTTHYLEEAERRCQRIVIIDHGRIVASGTLRDLVGSALGTSRALTVALGRPFPEHAAIPVGATLDPDRRVLRVPVRDVGADVGDVLRRVTDAGGQVSDISLAGATLQDVFIALTGRELRE